MLLTWVVIMLVFVLCVLVLALHRITSNVGRLDLEEHAKRNGIVYIPMSRELATQLETWSNPFRMQVKVSDNGPLAELILKKEERE